MSNENSAASREDFNTVESTTAESIAQKKQEIASALESGDFDSVATLAQEAKDIKAVSEAAKGEMIGEAHSEALENNKAPDEEKAAEEKAQRGAELAEQARLQSEKDAAEAAEVLARLQGQSSQGGAAESALVEQVAEVATEQTEQVGNVEAGPEGIYGMSLPELKDLIQSDGFLPEKIDADDPKFKEKYATFMEHNKEFKRAEVKLFDRVLSSEASEEEMEMAEEHARSRAKGYGVRGFNSSVPKAWYTNERIANAIAETSPDNQRWVNNVKENYSNEELRKQYREINPDGSVSTYERK